MLSGQPFTGVTTRECVEQAASLVDWDGFRKRQADLRAAGRYVGVGMASYLEAAPGPKVPGQERGRRHPRRRDDAPLGRRATGRSS